MVRRADKKAVETKLGKEKDLYLAIDNKIAKIFRSTPDVATTRTSGTFNPSGLKGCQAYRCWQRRQWLFENCIRIIGLSRIADHTELQMRA